MGFDNFFCVCFWRVVMAGDRDLTFSAMMFLHSVKQIVVWVASHGIRVHANVLTEE